jgi:hypothetical protein
VRGIAGAGTSTSPNESPPPRTRRGEGEVTQWPRGLVDYTPKNVPDDLPSPEEDRTGNRIRLAARLLALLRSQGRDVTREILDLAAAERAYTAGRHVEATRRVEQLLGELARRTEDSGAARGPTL